mmetsp:Transcript_2770/g.8253  ORF Transcript_2770/g.8253 Transcript_2770/m.8253 type:complete len:256 (-) Transcript_2770:849-1616(-)
MPIFMSQTADFFNTAMTFLFSHLTCLIVIATLPLQLSPLESANIGLSFGLLPAKTSSPVNRVPRCFQMCATSRLIAIRPLGNRMSPLSMISAETRPRTRMTSSNSSSSSHSMTSVVSESASSSSSLSSPSAASSSSSSSSSSSFSFSSTLFSGFLLLEASFCVRRSCRSLKCVSKSARPSSYSLSNASVSKPSSGSAPALAQAPLYMTSDSAGASPASALASPCSPWPSPCVAAEEAEADLLAAPQSSESSAWLR